MLDEDTLVLRPRIGVVEGGYHGHKTTYACEFALALQRCSYSVHLIAPTSAIAPMEGIYFHNYEDSDDDVQMRSLVRLVGSRIRRWNRLKNLMLSIEKAHSVKFDVLLVMSAGDFLSPLIPALFLNWLSPWPLVMVHVNPAWQLTNLFRFKRLRRNLLRHDHLLASRQVKTIATLCETALPGLREFANAKTVLLPDFCDTSLPAAPFSLAAHINEVRKGRKIVLLIGALAKRKNVDLFVELALASDPSKYLFVICGPWLDCGENSPCIRIQDEHSHVVVWDQRLPDEQSFNSVLSQADIIWVNYRDFYMSSNLLAKAAYFRRPVLAQNYGIIAKRVAKYHLGVTAPPDCAEGARAALDQLSAWSSLPENYGVADDGTRLLDMHSKDQLGNCLRECLWFLHTKRAS